MKGAKSPLRVQSTRIFKLFRKFKNTHSVAKRLFRHAGACCILQHARAHRRVGCTIVERAHRRGAHRASAAGYDLRSAGSRCTRSRRHVGMPPYARSGWRTALHAGSKRTRHARANKTIEPRRKLETGSGRVIERERGSRPPLRTFPAKFLCVFPGCLNFETAPFYGLAAVLCAGKPSRRQRRNGVATDPPFHIV